jgi:flagellar hook-associated protein 2
MATTSGPTFSALGMGSGMDDNSIIDNLVAIRSQNIMLLQGQAGAYQAQISAVGNIASKVSALKTALQSLSSKGALGVSVASSPDGFTATPSAQAQAGRYTVSVDALATAAKSRSTGFLSTSSAVTAGTLTIGIDGQNVDVNVGNGTLQDAATSINAQASGVSASVLWNGTNAYLSVTSRSTGFTSNDQLSFSGSAAAQFGFATVDKAVNAQVTVDDLQFTRQSNSFSDVIPGVAMALTQTGDKQELVLDNDTDGTAKNLQGFVDAYNTVVKSVQAQLDVAPGSDRSMTLAGDGSIRSLQQSIQSLTSTVVGSGSVRTLADLGITTARDGTISLDTDVLGKAIARDPGDVNTLFSTATTGLSAVGGAICDTFTDPVNGVLTMRTQGLQSSVKNLTTSITEAQAAADAYRQQLVAQYSAMENLVSGFKSIGNYLTQVSQKPSS